MSLSNKRKALFLISITVLVTWLPALILLLAMPSTHPDLNTLPTLASLPTSDIAYVEPSSFAVEEAPNLFTVSNTLTAEEQLLVEVETVEQIEAESTATSTVEVVVEEDVVSVTAPDTQVENQVVIQFAPGTSPAEQTQYISSFGGTITKSIDGLDSVVVNLPSNVDVDALPPSSIVITSEPDYYVVALEVNDPRYPEQWALSVIGASSAWESLPTDAPLVTVAVIDSGVCLDHPDLAANILPGYDYIDSDEIPQDDFGHGCGVAGVIAAVGNNGEGIAGIAPNARILPLRVLNAEGLGQYSNVAAAIVYAADNGAQIINLSLGAPYPSNILKDAIDYAIERGVVVIAAAGNNAGAVLYPAAYAPVIAVASVDQNLQLSSFSSRGEGVDALAPGRDILTTEGNNSYRLYSGTSFASPYVASIAALEIAHGRTLTTNGGLITFGGTSEGSNPNPPPQPTSIPGSTTFDGWLSVRYGDPLPDSTGPGIRQILLLNDQGYTIAELDVNINNAMRFHNQPVQITGQLVAQGTSSDSPPVIVVENISVLAGSAFDVSAQLMGSQPFVNILCRFSDNASQPHLSAWYQNLFGTNEPGLDHYWRQISYNNINLNGTYTVGQWYTLPGARADYIKPDGSFDLDQLAIDCSNQAVHEVNFPDYFGINMFFNGPLDCCAWGGSTPLTLDGVTRTYRTTWIPSNGAIHYIIAHEMGHGFGLPHSSGPADNPPSELDVYVSQWDVMSAGGNCTIYYYPDYGCVAAGTIAYHLNAEGWIPANMLVTVEPGTTQLVTLQQLVQPPNGINIPLIAFVPINGSDTHMYTVEVRDLRNSYDRNVPYFAVIIHDVDITRTGNAGHALVVDADDGNDNVNDAGAWWRVGETYIDSTNNISIHITSTDEEGTFTILIENAPIDNCDLTVAAGDVTGLINSINAANSSANPNTICLTRSTYTLTSSNNVRNGLPVITTPITILGNGATITRSQNAPLFRIFEVADTGDLTIERVTISGGRVGYSGTGHGYTGGGIISYGRLTVVNSTLTNNIAYDDGGSIAAYDSHLFISNSTISSSRVTTPDWGFGGGVYFSSNYAHSFTMSGSRIIDNYAHHSGGGIFIAGGTIRINTSAIEGNTADIRGGGMGLLSMSSHAHIMDNCISGNFAPLASGVYGHSSAYTVLAWYNWWGAPDGPSGAGPGSGDGISSYVEYSGAQNAPLPGCSTSIPNDYFENAEEISSLPATNTQTVFGSSISTDDPRICVYHRLNTVWYRYTAPVDQGLSLSTAGSNYDTALGIYEIIDGELTEIGCNDDASDSVAISSLSVELEAGVTYYVVVGNYGTEEVDASAALTLTLSSTLPANDVIENAITPVSLPYNNTQNVIGASQSAGDPSNNCVPSYRASVWYRYTASASNSIRVNTVGSNYDTVLGVYTGTPDNLNQIACNDDANIELSSFIEFDVISGVTYYILVGSYGNYLLPNDASLMINIASVPTLILLAPVPNTTITTGFGNPQYQWQDISDSTHYYLYVIGPNNTQIINEVIPDATYCNGTTCTIDATLLRENYRLTNGTYLVYLRTWNSSYIGPWRGPFTFTLNAPVPGLATMPSALNTNTLRPTLRWQLSGSALSASSFRLYFARTADIMAPIFDVTVPRNQFCGSPTGTSCNLLLPFDLVDGTAYSFYVMSIGSGGNSSGGIAGFAGPTNFTIDAPTPTLPSGIVANANGGRPIISWNDDSNTIQFTVYIASTSDILNPIVNIQVNRTTGTGNLCNSGICTYQTNANLANGSYSVYIRAFGPGGYSTGGVSGYGGPVSLVLNMDVPNIGGITSLSPTGTLTSGSPIFQWNTVANTNIYELFVGQPAPTYFPSLHLQQYNASAICTPHPGTCSVNPGLLLAEGNYGWTVRAIGPGGTSAWYNLPNIIAFSVDSNLPAIVTLNSPANAATVTTNTPSFTWTDNPAADYYNLYVATSTGTVLYNQWNRATRGSGQLCDSGTCSLTVPGVTLANGSYIWSVRAYTPTGMGPWNLPASPFSVAVTAASAPSLQQPADDSIVYSTNRPTFVWSSVSGATSYTLTVRNGMNTVVFTQNYPANTCTASCSVQVPNPLAYGGYNWLVTAVNQGGSTVSANFDFLSLSINTQPMMVQAQDAQVSGMWVEQLDTSALGNSYVVSGSAGDVLTLHFSGSAVDVVYVTGPTYGSFRIEVDGIVVQEVNAYTDTITYSNLVHVSDLGTGEHTLRIVPIGNTSVAIDALVIDGQVIAGEIVTATPVPTATPGVTATPEVTTTPEPTITSEPTLAPTEETPMPTVEPTLEPSSTPSPEPVVETPTEEPIP